ncbi:MAG: hypothetical protein U1F30_09365 [Steroidobacteraceae bacterium]
MPVFLSSDISPKGGEYTPLMTAVVNAHIHSTMAEESNRLGNDLRDAGFQRPRSSCTTPVVPRSWRARARYRRTAPVRWRAWSGCRAAWPGLRRGQHRLHRDGRTSFDIGVIADGQIRTQDFIPVN